MNLDQLYKEYGQWTMQQKICNGKVQELENILAKHMNQQNQEKQEKTTNERKRPDVPKADAGRKKDSPRPKA